jgi:hypothetical protein
LTAGETGTTEDWIELDEAVFVFQISAREEIAAVIYLCIFIIIN